MQTIWKYPLEITAEQTVLIPVGAKILSVLFQGDILCLWAMVDLDAPKVSKRIYIVGTGHDCDTRFFSAKHIGTVLQPDLPLVWHVFDAGLE